MSFYSMFHNDVTIVLQGRIHPDIDLVNLYTTYAKYAKVILVVYQNQLDLLKESLKEIETYEVIVNNQNCFETYFKRTGLPEKTNLDEFKNCFFQICSLQNSLKNVRTPYVLYCRLDHYYSNIDKIIEIGKEKKTFVTTSFVIRGIQNPHWIFHFSDCMIFSETIHLIEVINQAREEYKQEFITFRPNECRIWRPYLSKRISEKLQKNIFSISEYIQEVLQIMTIVPLHTLSPFRIRAGGQVMDETILPLETKSSLEYIVHGTSFMTH